MEKTIRDTLLLLELDSKEIRFFETNFLLGPATIQEITRHAKLERSTAYLIATTLKDKGFILEDFKHYKKKLTTVDPSILLRMVTAKQRRLARQEITLKEKLAELQALHSTSDIKPKVKVYEGVTGLLSIWQDILSITQEVLLWTNQETENKFFSPQYHDKFIRDRISKEIFLKVLAVSNEKGKILLKTDKQSLRETKILPPSITFTAETYIYGNKIAIIDWNKDIFGVILENEQITTSQRAMFNLQWIV